MPTCKRCNTRAGTACLYSTATKVAAHPVAVERVKTGFLTGSENPHCRNLNGTPILTGTTGTHTIGAGETNVSIKVGANPRPV